MAITRALSTALLEEGLREVYFEWLDLKSMKYPSLFDIKSSNKRKETDHSVAGIGMLTEKEEGEPLTYEDFVDGYDVEYIHKTFAKGIRATEEMIEDELYGVMKGRAKALANATRYRMEYDHASLFNNADATTIFTGGDGVALLSDSHPLIAVPGTTKDNKVSSSLSQSAIEDAVVHFKRMVNDRNLLVAMEPETLLIPPELEFDAIEILKSTGKSGTANNDVNAVAGRLKIVTWDFLTASDCWFVLAGKRYGAPISFKRKGVSFGRDGDFDTGDLKMKARVRYSYGFSDWRWCYGNAGS